MTREEYETLLEKFDELDILYNQIKEIIRDEDKHLFDSWKAGGFLIDSDILSMYPNLGEVVTKIEGKVEGEDEVTLWKLTWLENESGYAACLGFDEGYLEGTREEVLEDVLNFAEVANINLKKYRPHLEPMEKEEVE